MSHSGSYIMAETVNGEHRNYDYPGHREDLRAAHKVRMSRHKLRRKRKNSKK